MRQQSPCLLQNRGPIQRNLLAPSPSKPEEITIRRYKKHLLPNKPKPAFGAKTDTAPRTAAEPRFTRNLYSYRI